MLDRLRDFYRSTGLSQTELSLKLDVTPQYIHKLMKQQDSEPSERIILSTLKSFPSLNEEWLRTGKGSMYIELTREQEIARITANLFSYDETDFRYKLTRLLSEMSEEQIEQLQIIANKLADTESND